MSATSL